tara:strand:- start:114 stop:671 length:558 start_codon:yes stop_codon:yes gene_type:complete
MDRRRQTQEPFQDEYKIWVVNNKTEGVLCVPESCRVSVIHVSDQDDGKKRMAAIEARNAQLKSALSSHESIYAYSRPLDCCEGGRAFIPPNNGLNSRASPECILLEESIYLVIPSGVRTSVKNCIEEHGLGRLLVSFMSPDQTCSTQCALSQRQMNGTIIINKEEFGVLDVELDNPPTSPLSQLL